MKANKEKVESLWKWFNGNEQIIIDSINQKTDSEDDYIIENLNNLVLDIDLFTWEIGVGKNKSYSFTISPNRSKDLLKVSREVIRSAPKSDEWEFHYSKPAKEWNRSLIISDDYMNDHKIDAKNPTEQLPLQKVVLPFLNYLLSPELFELEIHTSDKNEPLSLIR